MPDYTKCRKCNRIVQTDHVDEHGNCCFCHEPEPTKPTRAKMPVKDAA